MKPLPGLFLWLLCLNVGAQCTRTFTTFEREIAQDKIWVEQVFKEAQCPLKWYPRATRILDRIWAVKAGKVDFISASTPLPERRSFALFSRPYAREKIVVVTDRELAARLSIRKMQDLAELSVGVIGPHFGYYGPDWERTKAALLQQQRFIPYKTVRHADGLIQRHQEHVLIETDDAAAPLIARTPRLVILPTVLFETDIVLMFSRKTVTEAEIEPINAAITRLLARGADPRR